MLNSDMLNLMMCIASLDYMAWLPFVSFDCLAWHFYVCFDYRAWHPFYFWRQCLPDLYLTSSTILTELQHLIKHTYIFLGYVQDVQVGLGAATLCDKGPGPSSKGKTTNEYSDKQEIVPLIQLNRSPQGPPKIGVGYSPQQTQQRSQAGSISQRTFLQKTNSRTQYSR